MREGACCQHNPKTSNSWKNKLGILNKHHTKMLLKTFYKENWSVYRDTLKNSSTLRPMHEISFWSILTCLDCIKCNEININFYVLESMFLTEYDMNIIHFTYSIPRKNSNILRAIVENCWLYFNLLYLFF